MPIAQLQPAPALIDLVHDRLLSAIVDGTLQPGYRLTQESAADLLGVSRQPVSHALQLLKRRGLLVESGKRGLAVAPIDGERIRDLYQVREQLDTLAARLAAERVCAKTIDKSEIDRVTRILAGGQHLDTNASIAEMIDADVVFHSAVYDLSGNPAIGETMAERWPHFMRSMGVVLTASGMRARVWRQHAEILEAIVAGNAKRAEDCARNHVAHAAAETATRLDTVSTAA